MHSAKGNIKIRAARSRQRAAAGAEKNQAHESTYVHRMGRATDLKEQLGVGKEQGPSSIRNSGLGFAHIKQTRTKCDSLGRAAARG